MRRLFDAWCAPFWAKDASPTATIVRAAQVRVVGLNALPAAENVLSGALAKEPDFCLILPFQLGAAHSLTSNREI